MDYSAEYIWLDGSSPKQRLRSRTRVVRFPQTLPDWRLERQDEEETDLILHPVRVVHDPDRADGLLVLCEVIGARGEPAISSALRRTRSATRPSAEPASTSRRRAASPRSSLPSKAASIPCTGGRTVAR